MLVCCFFVRQRTAYERRSSDWSSDGCSSDLRVDQHIDARRAGGEQFAKIGCADIARARRADADVGDGFEGQPSLPRRAIARRRIVGPAHRDVEVQARKSVVSGKSVSVRVDLGCRRIIKKKKVTQQTSL